MRLFSDVHRVRTITSIVALSIASATTGGVKAKVMAGPAERRNPPIAGAEQMRRQAQAAQLLRNGRLADAFGRLEG